MPALIFDIVSQKTIPVNFSDKGMMDFPVHEHYLVEVQKIAIIYKYKPTRKTEANFEAHVKYLETFLKRKYNAYSVTYGGLQEQLKQG